MGTSANWLSAFEHVEDARVVDAVTLARRVMSEPAELDEWLAEVPETWEPLPHPPWPDTGYVERLLEETRSDPDHPINWHKRLVNEQVAKPQPAQTYLKIRRAIWTWPEFASLRRGSRAILEVLIELAREEAFGWWIPVPAEDVRRLARLREAKYAECVRDLETLAITRPSRMLKVAGELGVPCFPGVVDETQSEREIAQFVVRYARGIPWNRKRAAWWINYDLLCETGRVLKWFAVEISQLPKTYLARNGRMGPKTVCHGLPSDPETIEAFERSVSKGGPIPPVGLRAALWEPPPGK